MSSFEQFYDQFGGEDSGYGLDYSPARGVGFGYDDDDDDDFGYEDDDDDFGAYEDWEIGAYRAQVTGPGTRRAGSQYVPTAADLTRSGFYEGYGDEYGVLSREERQRRRQLSPEARRVVQSGERASARAARRSRRTAAQEARARTISERAATTQARRQARGAAPAGQRASGGGGRTEAGNFFTNLFKEGGKGLLQSGVEEGTSAARRGIQSLSRGRGRPQRRRGGRRPRGGTRPTRTRPTKTKTMPISQGTASAVIPAPPPPEVKQAGMGGAVGILAIVALGGWMLMGKKK